MAEKVKILLCGDVEGKFNELFRKVESVMKKQGRFDALICVGNVFGINNKEFEPYKNGMKKVPIPTYILGANKEEHCKYFSEDEVEICENLCYLGKKGLYTSSGGLKVAYLSGVATSDAPKSYQYTSEDVLALRDTCYRGNPNFRGVDVLVTSQWPEDVGYNDPKRKIENMHSCSYQISWLASQLNPRYHISGLEGVYYERSPYRNNDSEIVTRFIGLARVGNPQKQKWIYALNLTPVNKMKILDLLQKTTDETSSPYDVAVLDAKINNKKRKHESGQQFFFDMNPIPEKGDKKKFKKLKKKMEFDQSKCWFCLGSPHVEKHLVVTISDHSYLALAKGSLVEDHFLICPVDHHQCSLNLTEEIIEDINKFKESLINFYAKENKIPVFFERNYLTSHMQIQSVPIPKHKVDLLKDLFMEKAQEIGLELEEVPKEQNFKDVIKDRESFFTIEVPSKDFMYINIKQKFPINFAREVLCSPSLLNLQDRVDWKNCVLDKEDENKLVKCLRKKYEPFDFTDD